MASMHILLFLYHFYGFVMRSKISEIMFYVNTGITLAWMYDSIVRFYIPMIRFHLLQP